MSEKCRKIHFLSEKCGKIRGTNSLEENLGRAHSSRELYHGGFETGTAFLKGKEIHSLAVKLEKSADEILDEMVRDVEH